MPTATTLSQYARNRLRTARRHLRALDTALGRARTYAHPAGRIVRIETHISIVYLAGRYAYKIMKPVDFGFVDFTRLDARRRCCDAEIRLNRPLAGSIYIEVQPLTRSARGCRLGNGGGGGNGNGVDGARVVDYAVRMRRFDQRMLFSNLLANDELAAADIDAAVEQLAQSYRRAPRVAPTLPFGTAAQLRDTVLAPLTTLERTPHTAEAVREAALRAWYERELGRLAPHLDARRAHGFVRACHGDLHLDNVVRHGRRALMFDCIEFNDALRWIDVANDFAFLYMDLLAHGRTDLANRLLAQYLETTGDYGCLPALRLYVGYRALVRAMVATLKHRPQPSADASEARYLRLAIAQTAPQRPALLLCHGFSGSGKSVASRALAGLSGAIRLSSDTERKRTRPFEPLDLRALPSDAYTPDAVDALYERLSSLAATVLGAGYTTIVDATFLKRAQRERFGALARRLGVPMMMLDFHADPACLAKRVRARSLGPRDASDAGEVVLAAQLAQADPLSAEERASTITFDTDVPIDTFMQRSYWDALFERSAACGRS